MDTGILLSCLKDLLFCAVAVFFFSITIGAPRKTMPVSALIGAVAYVVYYLISSLAGQDLLGYFIGSVICAVAGEILARIMKMPSTVFVFPAIIPLVPGYSLYRTMLMLVQKDYNGFAKSGANTLFIAGAIAIAVAVTNIIARNIFAKNSRDSAK